MQKRIPKWEWPILYRQAMMAKKFSRGELAELTGIDELELKKAFDMAGTPSISIDTHLKLCAILNIDPQIGPRSLIYG